MPGSGVAAAIHDRRGDPGGRQACWWIARPAHPGSGSSSTWPASTRSGDVKLLVVLMISTALAACGPSRSSSPADADAGGDASDRWGGADVPAGFFIVGDIDGQTWLATHNITPVENNFLFEVATVEPSPPSREWQFNFNLPTDPFPYTLECVGNYIEFHEIGFDPERRFVSRTATSTCAVTFVEPAVPDTVEGTFVANLTLRGTTTDYAVTNGRFRLPRAR
jgi:hypothetical protein